MMVPQITGVMNGLNIWKHQAIKRARTPIRIAISMANSMYDFSWVILSGWFIMFSPVSANSRKAFFWFCINRSQRTINWFRWLVMIDFWISSRTSKLTVAERHRSNKNYCFWAYYDLTNQLTGRRRLTGSGYVFK